MKKYILIFFLGTLVISSCKKTDIFDYEIPTGRINGTVKWESDNTPVNDLFLLFTNLDNGAMNATYTKEDGTFSMSMLSTGSYSVAPINDSIWSNYEYTTTVTNGKVTQIGDILVEVSPYPDFILDNSGVMELTSTSVTLKTLTELYGNSIAGRGYKILKTSDARDPMFGTTKSVSSTTGDYTLDYFSLKITGLSANTEYKVRAYVSLYRHKPDGTLTTKTVYSDIFIFSTQAPSK